ncbi:glycosyltransferase [Mucilaginibacter pedocola]|uniref:Glycosyl transferase family 1 domain-containing protein n=1 Tax=Mucilaginibacter pedocola TaxID=1792845 RepID=A0A1S9P8V0_9SPHI|nr:glycosyltransferase [Mucilaginibacter pedocola]OOQ57267.1 hypothetical protein BC343_14215 [Mucilaginibacter pedocola]
MPDTLVIISPAFPAHEGDGFIPQQQVFVRTLKQTYPELHLIVLALQYPAEAKSYTWHGVEIIAFGGKGRGRLHRVMTWLKAWRVLQKLYKQHQLIGILSFWLGEASFVGSMFAKWKGLKHYAWLLGQDAKAGNKYARWIKPKSDELIAISDFVMGRYFDNYGIRPAHVIPVGVEPAALSVDQLRDIDILGAGSLIPLKRYHLFVKLIFELTKSKPGIKATLCGGGPELKALQEMIANLGLEDNLTLVGEIPHWQVLALMQRTKVFVHPSEYEGFSTVCLEAIYAGCCVVSYIRPMNHDIANWHIINSEVELERTVQGLSEQSPAQGPNMLPYPVADNVKAMMVLFGYNE